jgi:hypothetical protein
LVGLAKVMARLTPRQLNDEFALATAEMKQKGVKAGVAAAFMVVALLFAAALAIALIVAAILGLGTIMPDWLAALRGSADRCQPVQEDASAAARGGHLRAAL